MHLRDFSMITMFRQNLGHSYKHRFLHGKQERWSINDLKFYDWHQNHLNVIMTKTLRITIEHFRAVALTYSKLTRLTFTNLMLHYSILVFRQQQIISIYYSFFCLIGCFSFPLTEMSRNLFNTWQLSQQNIELTYQREFITT